MTTWGNRPPNGRDIYIGVNLWWEGSTAWDSPNVTVHVEIHFHCGISSWDTSNTLSWSGDMGSGSQANTIYWPSARTANDIIIKSWTGTVDLQTGVGRTIAVSATLNGWSNAGDQPLSATAYLDIPARDYGTSTLTSYPNTLTMGSPYQIAYDVKNSTFRHTFYWNLGNSSWKAVQTGITSSPWTWTNPPVDVIAPYMPNATSGSGSILLETYTSSGGYVGGDQKSGITYVIPSTVVPAAGTFTTTEGNSAVTAVIGSPANTFVQNLSKISAAYSGESGIYGSTVSKVEFTVGSATYTASGSPYVTPFITSSGTVSVTKKVTDSRGRTAQTSSNVTVLPYAAPNPLSLTVDRADSAGNLLSYGKYGKATFSVSGSSLVVSGAEKNSLQYKLEYRLKGSTGAWTTAIPLTTASGFSLSTTYLIKNEDGTGPFDPTLSYEFQLTATDAFSSATRTANVASAAVSLAVAQNGIGVNKIWERGAIDVGGNEFVNGYSSIGDPTAFNKVRYVRDFVVGNTANGGAHWVEIQAFEGAINRALNKPVTHSMGYTTNIARVTDGVTSDSNLYFDAGKDASGNLIDWLRVSLTVDLGAQYAIDTVKIWRYYADGRTYLQTKTQVSSDGINWRTIFDSDVSGTYAETSSGKTIPVPQISLATGDSFNAGKLYEGSVPISDSYIKRGEFIYGHMGRDTAFHYGNSVWGVVAMSVDKATLSGGMGWNSGAWGLIVPKNGFYKINMQAYFTGPVGYYMSAIYINGNDSGIHCRTYKSSSSDEVYGSSSIRRLTKGDMIRFFFYGDGQCSTWGTDKYNGSWIDVEYIPTTPI